MAGSPDCSRETHTGLPLGCWRADTSRKSVTAFAQTEHFNSKSDATDGALRVALRWMLHWVECCIELDAHWVEFCIECNRQLDTISNYPAWFMSQNRDRSDCFKSSRRLALQIKQMHFAKSSETHIQISKFCGDLELLYKANFWNFVKFQTFLMKRWIISWISLAGWLAGSRRITCFSSPFLAERWTVWLSQREDEKSWVKLADKSLRRMVRVDDHKRRQRWTRRVLV